MHLELYFLSLVKAGLYSNPCFILPHCPICSSTFYPSLSISSNPEFDQGVYFQLLNHNQYLLNIELAYNPALPLLGEYPREMKTYVHIKPSM